MNKSIDAIKGLIIINVIFFLPSLVSPELKGMMRESLALFFPENDNFKVWQFISHMFMHGSFVHTLFNMYALWAFGTPLLQIWGQKRFLLFYFLCGLGAGIIYTSVNYIQFNSYFNEMVSQGISESAIYDLLQTGNYGENIQTTFDSEWLQEFYNLFWIPAVGASGAIYGVLVAFGIMFPNAKLALLFFPVPVAAKYFIPGMLLLDLFSGITGFSLFGGGIAHFAHIGGAIIGFLLMWYWRQKGYKGQTFY